MGLDTTHDCWHGSYSRFHRWRRAVAHAAKYPPLDLMEGFCNFPAAVAISLGARVGDVSGMSEGQLQKYLPISWDKFRSDALTILLHHSDCEGVIKSAHCAAIAERLDSLLDTIEPDWLDETAQFARGLREAAEAGEDVEFH